MGRDKLWGMDNLCLQCSRPLVKPDRGRPQSKYCSRKCKADARDARRVADVQARRAGRTCAQCSGPIPEDRNNRSVTCSPECGVAHQNARRAAQRRAEWDATKPPCEECGGPIPRERRAGVKFCSVECKGRAQARRWRETAPGYMRQYLYGITPDQFAAMLEQQGGRCAICGTTDWKGKDNAPHVDHDHDTKRVRGILCGGCNNGLGNFADDPARLRAAAEYLERNM